MIEFRKKHPVIRKNMESSHTGYPFTSIHGVIPNAPDYSTDSHVICVLFAGFDPEVQKEDLVYIAINTYWQPVNITLPPFPGNMLHWKVAVNTGDPMQNCFPEDEMPDVRGNILMKERSVIIFEAAMGAAAIQTH